MSKNDYINFIMLVFSSVFASSVNAGSIIVAWPKQWGVAPVVVFKNTELLQAMRIDSGGNVIQSLKLTIINMSDKLAELRKNSFDLKLFANRLMLNAEKESGVAAVSLKKFSETDGYYFANSNPNPGAGYFKNVIEGVVVIGGFFVKIHYQFDAVTDSSFQKTINIIEGLSLSGATEQ